MSKIRSYFYLNQRNCTLNLIEELQYLSCIHVGYIDIVLRQYIERFFRICNIHLFLFSKSNQKKKVN